jgi:ABC-type lipoprotein release transport system permease subunit
VDLDVSSQKLEEFGFVARRQAVGRIAALESVTTVPLVLAALLSVTALAAMIHTLISTTRRRRRDLAILKTIGFVRRQVVSTIAWQSAAIVVLALILGIPGGIAAGRWGWRLFADQIAVVPSSDVPGGQVAALIPAALALAVLVSLLPGRAAARTRPSVTLRTE